MLFVDLDMFAAGKAVDCSSPDDAYYSEISIAGVASGVTGANTEKSAKTA